MRTESKELRPTLWRRCVQVCTRAQMWEKKGGTRLEKQRGLGFPGQKGISFGLGVQNGVGLALGTDKPSWPALSWPWGP